MRRQHRGLRGGMTPGTMFLVAAAILLVAVAAFYFFRGKTEEKKRELVGKVGAVSRFKLEREPGINPPFADQAAPGTAAPETTVEMPIEWGKDVKGTQEKLNQRYDAVEKGLTRSGEIYDATITFRIDRDLEYRTLYQAVMIGVDRGFVKFQVACYPSGESREVRYLRIEPPADFQPGRNVLLFRLYSDAGTTRYIFGVSKTREYPTLAAAAQVMKNTPKSDATVLVLGPTLDISVQNVIEALNAVTYAGFQKITLNRMKVE